jgi:hypothetical protein
VREILVGAGGRGLAAAGLRLMWPRACGTGGQDGCGLHVTSADCGTRARLKAWRRGFEGRFLLPSTTVSIPAVAMTGALVDGYDVVREAAEVRRSIALAAQSAALREELTAAGRQNPVASKCIRPVADARLSSG